jgi:hypothetical protein
MDAFSRLSQFERHAFAVAIALGFRITCEQYMYAGQHAGRYRFRNKLTGKVVLV